MWSRNMLPNSMTAWSVVPWPTPSMSMTMKFWYNMFCPTQCTGLSASASTLSMRLGSKPGFHPHGIMGLLSGVQGKNLRSHPLHPSGSIGRSSSLTSSNEGWFTSLRVGSTRLVISTLFPVGLMCEPGALLLSASRCSNTAWLTWCLNAPSCHDCMSLARSGIPWVVQCAVTSSMV